MVQMNHLMHNLGAVILQQSECQFKCTITEYVLTLTLLTHSSQKASCIEFFQRHPKRDPLYLTTCDILICFVLHTIDENILRIVETQCILETGILHKLVLNRMKAIFHVYLLRLLFLVLKSQSHIICRHSRLTLL